ncbi:hypothetical protein PoB_001539800 [Plakobranchus ocellatus]|uniref:Uncharacterized protein n=1 Tax=Plakobranchus ocellatus TaxID=259542 RepID=A0AAV3Z296_9GAST|nr:hypothetical protein PoB_001539800 [Plakobranchus ocellatus]
MSDKGKDQVSQKIDEKNQEENNQGSQPVIPLDNSERDNMGTLQSAETNPEGDSPQPHSTSSSTDPHPHSTSSSTEPHPPTIESNASNTSQATTTPSTDIKQSESIIYTSKNTNSDRVQDDIADTPILPSDNDKGEVGNVRDTAQIQANTVDVQAKNIADTAKNTLDSDSAETERITERAKTMHTTIIPTKRVDHTSAESAADSNAVEAISVPGIYSSTSDSDPDSYSGSDTLSSGTESDSYASAKSMPGPESLQPSANVANEPSEVISDTKPYKMTNNIAPAEAIAGVSAEVSSDTKLAVSVAETVSTTATMDTLSADSVSTDTVSADTTDIELTDIEFADIPTDTTGQAVTSNATNNVSADTDITIVPAETAVEQTGTANATISAETATITVPAENIAVLAGNTPITMPAKSTTVPAETTTITVSEIAAPTRTATVTVPAETPTVTAEIAAPAETATVTVTAETTAVLPGKASTTVPAENATVPAEIITAVMPAEIATAAVSVPSHKTRGNANLNLPAAGNVEGIASLVHAPSATNTAPVRVTATTAASITEAEAEAAAFNILTGASLEGCASGGADSTSSSTQSITTASAEVKRPAGQGVRSRPDNSVRPSQYNGARPRPNTRMSNRSGTSAQVDSQRRSDTRNRRKRNTTRTVSQEDIREMKKAAQVFKSKVENIAKERRLKIGKVKAALSDVHKALTTCQNRLRNRTFNTSHCENDLDRAAQTVQTFLEKIRQCLNSHSGPSTELADRDDVYGLMNQAAGIAGDLRKKDGQQICLDARLGGVRAAEHSEAGLMENIATANAQCVTSQSATNADVTTENIPVSFAEKSDNPPPAGSNEESSSRDREECSYSSTASSILPSFVIDTEKVPRNKFQGKRFKYNQNYSIINLKITPGRPGQNTKISIYENVPGFYPSNRAQGNQNGFNGRNSGQSPRSNAPFPRQNRWRYDRAGTARRASVSSEYSHTSHRTPSLGDSNAFLQGTNSHMGPHNFFGVNLEEPDFGRKFFHYIHALYLFSHPGYVQFVQNDRFYTQQGHSALQALQYRNPPTPCQLQKEERAQTVEMYANENNQERNSELCTGQTVHRGGMSSSSDGNASEVCFDSDASEDSKKVSVENCLKTLTFEICRLQKYCATPPGSIEVFNREIKRIQEFSYREKLEDSEKAGIEKLTGKLNQVQESTAPCSGSEQDQCKDDEQTAAYSETDGLSKDARSSGTSSSNPSPHQRASAQQSADSNSPHNRQTSDHSDSVQLDRSGNRPSVIPTNRHIRRDSGNAYYGAERKETFRGYNVDVDVSLQRWPGKRKTRYCQQNNKESLTGHNSNYNRPWPPKNPYIDMEDNFQNPGNGDRAFPGRKSTVLRLGVALPRMANDKYLSNLNALVVLEKEGLLLALDLRNKYVKQYVMSEEEKEKPQFLRSGHESLLDTQPLFMCKLNENMVVVACKDRKLAVLKCVRSRNHPEYLLTIKCLRQYAGLAYLRDDVLACSSFSRRCVDIVHVKNEEIETTTIVNTHNYAPETLCYLPEIGQIVFLERSETEGLRLVGVTEAQEIKFREPFDPSVANSWNIARYQNNIVACCKTTNQFKLLTPGGKYLAEFNFKKGDINQPFGMYFDTKGRFYVANEGTQNNGVFPDIKAFVMR